MRLIMMTCDSPKEPQAAMIDMARDLRTTCCCEALFMAPHLFGSRGVLLIYPTRARRR